MIRIQKVQGRVAVHDEKNGACFEAQNGMQLDEAGSWLIATDSGASAKIMFGSQIFSLDPSSAIYVGGKANTPKLFKHYQSWGFNSKIFIGRVWAKIQGSLGKGGPPKDDGGNAVVGVRG